MMGAAYVVPTLAQLGFTAAAFSRISQMTMMAIIASLVVAVTAELWQAQVEQSRTSTEQLRLAMSDVIEQRRLTRTIVNGVDVGLVAIDAEGAYDSMNPRHREFLGRRLPRGPPRPGRPDRLRVRRGRRDAAERGADADRAGAARASRSATT